MRLALVNSDLDSRLPGVNGDHPVLEINFVDDSAVPVVAPANSLVDKVTGVASVIFYVFHFGLACNF